MLYGLFINTAHYVRMSQCHNSITSFQKIVLHGFRYQRDQAEKTTTYCQYKCLPSVFRNELKPLFTRLSDTKLLQRLLKGLIQNANKAINLSLWSKGPKHMFCTKTKLKLSVAASITEWNTTAAGTNNVFKKIGVDCGINKYIEDIVIICGNSIKKSPNTTSNQYGACSTNAEEKIMKQLFIDESKIKLLKIS